jgi:hypothetical protein
LKCLTGSNCPPSPVRRFLSTEDLRQAYDILRDPEKRSAFEAVYRRFGPQATGNDLMKVRVSRWCTQCVINLGPCPRCVPKYGHFGSVVISGGHQCLDFGALLVDVSQGPEAANVFRQAGQACHFSRLDI